MLNSPVLVIENNDKKDKDSEGRRAVALNEKNITTDLESERNDQDDQFNFDKLIKTQSSHSPLKNRRSNNSRLMTGVSGQAIIEEHNVSRQSLNSPKTSQERKKKLTNSKEKDPFNSNSLQCNNEDLVVEIKKLKASNSFTNKIVESAVKCQEKNEESQKSKLNKKH